MTYQEIVDRANKHLFIIGEIGVNHNGDLSTAIKLVDAAIFAGCDAVKFQTWITEKVYSEERSIVPDYQKTSVQANNSEFQLIKELELSQADFDIILAYCKSKDIMFFSTPDEQESADFLVSLGVGLLKIGSQDVTNTPFLKYIAQLNLPIIFSTGASTMSEVAKGVEAISAHTKDIILLHCVSAYPAPAEEMNLAVLNTLSMCFGYPVGLSDHTTGHEVACAALGFGARFFEKHLTLDKTMVGPDHKASLEPDEMKSYCQALKKAHSAIGNGIKRIMPSEVNTRKAFRRFMVAARDLPSGSILCASDIEYKKVVDGIAPDDMERILGKHLRTAVKYDTPFEWSMFL